MDSALLSALSVALAFLVYRPILGCFFRGDDFFHLFDIVNRGPLDFVAKPGAGHLTLSSNSVFLLLYEVFGARPGPYFVVVLLTHLLNVWLLFRLLRGLTASPRLACFGAVLWGTTPLHEGTLDWYSVYGQVLATTAMLAIVLLLADRRRRGLPLAGWSLGAACGLLFIAATSFGTGVGFALVFPVAALLLVPQTLSRRGSALAVLAIPLATGVLYVALYWIYLTNFDDRSPAVVLFLVGQLSDTGAVLAMFGNLVGAGVSGLLGGLLAPGLGIPPGGRVGLMLVAVFAVIVASSLRRAGREDRRTVLALLVLAVGCYAVIAAGRSKIDRLGPNLVGLLVTPTRYHYSGAAFLAAALCVALAALCRTTRVPARIGSALLGVWLAGTAVAWERGALPIDTHEAARAETENVLLQIRRAAAAVPVGGTVQLPNKVFVSVGMTAGTPELFPGWAALFSIYAPADDTVDGRKIRFVARDARDLGANVPGRPITRLLLPPRADR